MTQIKLAVKRNRTLLPDDLAEQQRLHRERAKLLHNFVDTLDIPVESWGEADTAKPHEVVEIIVALGSAGVFTAVVAIAKAWIEQSKIQEVTLTGPAGSVVLKHASAADVVAIAQQIGFKIEAENRAYPPGTT